MGRPKTRATIRQGRHLACLVTLLWTLCGCDEDHKDQITLQVGHEQAITFEVHSGFAHYYELPGHGDMLRIILASYEIGCMEYRSPEPGEVFVAVTVRVPPNETLAPGTFEWKGVVIDEAEDKDEEESPVTDALPFVRLAQAARALPPGGQLKLRKFAPERFGLVQGQLAFRDAETGQVASTALLGDFSVRICHADLDPARRTSLGAE
jgi:hypothetical protein